MENIDVFERVKGDFMKVEDLMKFLASLPADYDIYVGGPNGCDIYHLDRVERNDNAHCVDLMCGHEPLD